MRYLRDGEPRTVEATAISGQGGEVWWRADVPLRNPVTSYRWFLSGGSTGYAWLNGSGLHAHEVPAANDFRILAEPGGPDWHASSVVYEIFIDRFATSGTPRPSPLWAVPREWGRLPEARTRNTNRELFGGDLPGIENHLAHVESLGANVLYLTSFFPAESNHRYDPLSFDRVDPVLGGDEALLSLAAAARARGLRLIGDVSLDRCGAEHEWFRRAQADPTSTERSLFMFERSESEAYVSWLGTARYPRFDWRSADLRTRMSGVLQRWLAAGLDGWRVGAANMVGRYRDADLNTEIARWSREQVRDGLLIAEYSHDFEQDVDGLGWHGVMNYAGFLRPVWWWLRSGAGESTAFDVFLSTPAPAYGGAEAASVLDAFRIGVPWEVVLQSWLPLDTHDTPRIRTVVGSRERQLVGVGLQMTSPGVPSVFAGSELGIEGAWGQDARRTMPWRDRGDWDEALLDGYRRLIALRRSSEALARGGIRYAHVADDAIAYLRETRTERLLCLAARAPHEAVVVPFRELETLYGDDACDGVLPADGPAFHVWRVAS